MNMRKYLSFLFCVLFLFGCTTIHATEQFKTDGGSARLYSAPFDKTFGAALHACEMLNLKVERQSKEHKVIVAANGMSMFSYGERVGIYLTETSPTETEVRVISKPKIKTHIFAPKWSGELLDAIQTRLEQLSK